MIVYVGSIIFFLPDPSNTEIYPLSLHDALPICVVPAFADVVVETVDRHLAEEVSAAFARLPREAQRGRIRLRSEEHTSELQSRENLVCRLLLEKKKEKR